MYNMLFFLLGIFMCMVLMAWASGDKCTEEIEKKLLAKLKRRSEK